MPGLFGIALETPSPELTSTFERMWKPAGGRFHGEHQVDVERGWALGRTHLGVFQPGPQLRSGDRVQVLFHGDLHNLRDLEEETDSPARADLNPEARVIGTLYRRFGAESARRLKGSYCALILDEAQRRLVLLTDPLGSYPLYWTKVRNGFVFASELRAVLRHPDVRCELNPAALADYLTFGCPWGVRTLAKGVDLVPPGSTLIFEWDTGRVTISQHTGIRDAFDPGAASKSDYIDHVRAAFSTAVGRALSGSHQFGLSLSGGLDTRAILSAVNGASSSLSTYTVGVKGCADETIARQLANVAGTQHTFFELDGRYLHDFLPNLRTMVSLTDGMYLTHGLTEMLALEFLSGTGIEILLRGHGGELAKARLAWPLHTDDRILSFTTTPELVQYLLERFNYISGSVSWRDLFTSPWFEQMGDGARSSLEQSLAGLDLSPPDACSYLYVHELHRRFTTASLELFRQAVEVRLPFVDWTFMQALFRGPAVWRDDTSIHRALIDSGNPALLRIRNSNTGAPANAGPLAEFAFDKLNSVFRRLNVTGYRHYHNFQAWMQSQLLSSVEATLLDRVSLDREIVREAYLRRLIDETREKRADHSYFLQVLMIVELWQREHEGAGS